MFHQLGLRAFQIGSLHRIHRAAGQTGQHDQFIIHVVDVRSNDDLILSARVHGAHDAFDHGFGGYAGDDAQAENA